jgi:xanthine dehydrogenase/oxidase
MKKSLPLKKCCSSGRYVHFHRFISAWSYIYFGCSYNLQVVGVVLATSSEVASAAMKKIKIQYELLDAIISIDDAVAASSFYPQTNEIERGDMQKHRSEADIIVEKQLRVGGQEHFYLEPQCAVAFPSDGNCNLDVYTSAQGLQMVQSLCSSFVGMDFNRINVKCKRMGGAFGGKESRSAPFAMIVALAARLTGRAVSLVLERDVDMCITGQRHSYVANYKAGCCSKAGKLKFLDVELFNNAGSSMDLSIAVIQKTLLQIDSVYYWPALRATGKNCRTNINSNTGFRGFGAPQAVVIAESVIEHLCAAGGFNISEFRTNNFYCVGDLQHTGNVISDFNIPLLWQECSLRANVKARQEAVEEYNRRNKWKKRGLSMIAVQLGAGFEVKFLNQAGALVNIYVDGTVLISHGGTEMGQGLHTKMIQIAAQCLQIPSSLVHINGTSTSIVPNASPTAGSVSTDLYGMAVLDACEKLKARLESKKSSMPPSSGSETDTVTTWKELVSAAYFDRIDLSAHGFYVIPDNRCGYDFTTKQGIPYNYFTQGVACSEVEVDVLTGNFDVLRVDICMDLGKSINPGVDIGQIEGAFTQGYGWSTMEELIRGDADHVWIRPKGSNFTRGPGTYKIPSFNDVPRDLRVHLVNVTSTGNTRAVHSSKAIGEPPILLGCTVYFAIQVRLFCSSVTVFGLQVCNIFRTQSGLPEAILTQRMAPRSTFRPITQLQAKESAWDVWTDSVAPMHRTIRKVVGRVQNAFQSTETSIHVLLMRIKGDFRQLMNIYPSMRITPNSYVEQ